MIEKYLWRFCDKYVKILPWVAIGFYLIIIRHTWGKGLNEAHIKYDEFYDICGACPETVARGIRALEAHGLLEITKKMKTTNLYKPLKRPKKTNNIAAIHYRWRGPWLERQQKEHT